MKLYLILFLFLISNKLFSQIRGTTENGENVILYSNGTWEYKESNNSEYAENNYIFLNDKRLVAGQTEIINTNSCVPLDCSISVTIAKDGGKTFIIFWQEVVFIPLKLWNGNVKLYLADNSIITLIDRNIKGENKLSGDINQTFAAYNLSSSDIIKLKKSNLSRVTYTDDDKSTIVIEVNENSETVINQLYQINR